MKFPPHSEFLEACLTEFVISYRPDKWAWNGPRVITTTFTKLCGHNSNCSLVKALPQNCFYPLDKIYSFQIKHLPYNRSGHWKCFFDVDDTQTLWNIFQKQSYAVHLNSKITAESLPSVSSTCDKLFNAYRILLPNRAD